MLVRNRTEPDVASNAHASGISDEELREMLRRQERARDLRAQLDFGPYDETEVITLLNSGRWRMKRNELHGDPEGDLVWHELFEHRLKHLPKPSDPPADGESEDVLVATEQVAVQGQGQGEEGSILINGRELTNAYARQTSGVAKCAMSGNIAGLRLELQRDPAGLNRVDAAGNAPLTLAALRGQTRSIEVLVQAGATLDYQDQKGWSAAHSAVLGQAAMSPRMLRLLFNAGAHVDLRDRNGATPAYHAATLNKLACLQTLALIAPNTLAEAANDGTTPLHAAAGAGSHRAVEFLLGFGVALEASDRYGETAAHKAARALRDEAFMALRMAGANLQVPNVDGATPSDVMKDRGPLYVTDERDARAVVWSTDPEHNFCREWCRPHSDPSGRVVAGPTSPLRAAAAAVVRSPNTSPAAARAIVRQAEATARKNAAHECALVLKRAQAYAARDAITALEVRQEVRQEASSRQAAERARCMLVGARVEAHAQAMAEHEASLQRSAAKERKRQLLEKRRKAAALKEQRKHAREIRRREREERKAKAKAEKEAIARQKRIEELQWELEHPKHAWELGEELDAEDTAELSTECLT